MAGSAHNFLSWIHVGDRVKGSHQIYIHPANPKPIPVLFLGGDLKRGLLAGILKDAGITREELLRMVQ